MTHDTGEKLLKPVQPPKKELGPIVNLVMRVVVSLVVLLSAIYIIVRSGSSDAEHKWAFGAVGTVLGYWLKT